jgi:hypothetical protein
MPESAPRGGSAGKVCVIGVVAMGVYPEPWVQAALRIAATLF